MAGLVIRRETPRLRPMPQVGPPRLYLVPRAHPRRRARVEPLVLLVLLLCLPLLVG
jgi:hypothetical protein